MTDEILNLMLNYAKKLKNETPTEIIIRPIERCDDAKEWGMRMYFKDKTELYFIMTEEN
jgi:hypothetical protein